MDNVLQRRSLLICLGLGLVIIAVFGSFLASEEAMPFGDGVHYITRAFVLHGYLHEGHFIDFWNLLVSPKQSIAPLHYGLFFLLPQVWAKISTYILAELLTTYLLLAIASYKICSVLQKPGWGPTLFLLCALQNYSMDYAYAFFLDMQFLAAGMLALAWQIRAWRDPTTSNSILSGIGVGLLFWIKPANALIFLATYLLAECIHPFLSSNFTWKRPLPKGAVLILFHHWGRVFLGFSCLALPAFLCGAGQSILLLIDSNEIAGPHTLLECTGLLRLFYFPLCLTYFYHVVGLGTVFTVIIGTALWFGGSAIFSVERFPAAAFIPVLASYLIFGEFFSFMMYLKTLRCLLLVLPVMWLAIFWMLEQWRIRPVMFFAASLVYAALAISNILFGGIEGSSSLPDDYQLTGSSLTHISESWSLNKTGTAMNKEVCDAIKASLPQGGAVSVNTHTFYLNSICLYWSLNYRDLLNNEPPRYRTYSLFAGDGKYHSDAMTNVNVLILFSPANFNTNQQTYDSSSRLVQYGVEQWVEKDGSAVVLSLPLNAEYSFGYEILFQKPFTKRQFDAFRDASEMDATSEQTPSVNEVFGRHYSWVEAWGILSAWMTKRMHPLAGG